MCCWLLDREGSALDMVNLLESASELGPSFLVGFGEGFLIAAGVMLIRTVVKVFKRVVTGSTRIE